MAFSFGSPAASYGAAPAAFSFGGAAAPAPAAAGGGFSFGGAAAATPAPAAAPAAALAAASGFSFGGAAAAAPAPAAAPAAAGGFSFGSPTPAAAPAAETTPAAAADAFSFGAAAPAAAATAAAAPVAFGGAAAAAPPAAGGGFSFGGAAAPATSTAGPTPAATPAPAAAVAGFSFGGPSTSPAKPVTTPTTATPALPAAGFSLAATSTPTPAAPATTPAPPGAALPPPPPPAAYKSLTVEEIINSWTSTLEADSLSFSKQANLVSEHDGVLRDATRSISELTDNVSRLLMRQEHLDETLGAVSSYQSELTKSLDTLESSIDGAFASRSSMAPQDSDLQREQAYQRLIDAEHRLSSVTSSISGIVGDLNAAGERNNAEGSLGQIVQILNAHYETLTFLERSSKNIENEISLIGAGAGAMNKQ